MNGDLFTRAAVGFDKWPPDPGVRDGDARHDSDGGAWRRKVRWLTLPANMENFRSFNIYTVPEPSTFVLAGLGAASLLIFRRRK